MGYRVHREDDKFKVVEVNDGEVRDIASGLDQAKAALMARHMNFGGAFDGWTPNFFLNRFQVSV
jgi:hypothetical protein